MRVVSPRLLAAAGVIAAGLTLGGPALAHEGERAPIVHEIDHLRRDANGLRVEAGRRPYPSDLSHRAIADRDYRLALRAIWRKRFASALERSVWSRLAECESNGRWHIDADFDGGLQFHPDTWSSYRPDSYPAYAYQATPGQQIRVARRVLADQTWNAWPACSAALGLR
ncbi:MAG: transglycosylase family protein [Gaiellales bacterium]